MPRAQTSAPVLPNLEVSLFRLNVDDLKWYTGVLPGNTPPRKGDLVATLTHALTDPAALRKLWSQLTAVQQQGVAEVVHNLGGLYNADLIEAKYPGSQTPKNPRTFGYSFYVIGGKRESARPFDLFFYYSYELGRYTPSDLIKLLRSFVPPAPPAKLESREQPPEIPNLKQYGGQLPDRLLSESEQAIFHDLGATLYLVQQGKAGISPPPRPPNQS